MAARLSVSLWSCFAFLLGVDISYKKRIASPGWMQDTGSLGLVHWDDPEGWYGEGCGRGVQDGEHVCLLICLILAI